MREVILQRPESGGSAALHRVMDDILSQRARGARVYRTYCRILDQSYDLTTTSKETHLELGTFSEEGIISLCQLLRDEMRDGNCTELLLLHPEKKGAVYVAMSSNDGLTTFHLSPAH